jgi:predicted O-methyltransferase YrrM
MALLDRRFGRRFRYDRRLLPNSFLAKIDPDPEQPSEEMLQLHEQTATTSEEGAALQQARGAALDRWLGDTSMSPGYPAWNLLYYSVLCSLVPMDAPHVVIETGTNRGLSTIAIAQALKDTRLETVVETVDIDPTLTAAARENVAAAGLSDYVKFHTGDSLEFLTDLAARVPHIDFGFIDGDHHAEHVIKEVDIVCPKVAVRRGKLYFDNSSKGGVFEALQHLKGTFGGNLVEFGNVSWRPPGNTIWQAD